MAPIDIAIVSELELLAQGVEALLQREPRVRVVARHSCSSRAVAALDGLHVDVILASFFCATRTRVLTDALSPNGPRLIIFADPDDSIDMKQLIRSGVSGVVLTTMTASLLVQSILKVHAGGVWLEKQSVLRQFQREEEGGYLSALSERESDVFRMAVQGLRNRDIGERLFISEATVKVHLSNIFDKLNVRSRVELCLLSQKRKGRATASSQIA